MHEVPCILLHYTKINKFPEILGELSMPKQCVPGSFFFSAHAQEPGIEAISAHGFHKGASLLLMFLITAHGVDEVCFVLIPWAKKRKHWIVTTVFPLLGWGFFEVGMTHNLIALSAHDFHKGWVYCSYYIQRMLMRCECLSLEPRREKMAKKCNIWCLMFNVSIVGAVICVACFLASALILSSYSTANCMWPWRQNG